MVTELNSSISVVIATLNEEEGIGPTIVEMRKVLNNPYMVVIDGNSVDRTIEIAKNMGADVMLQEGRGKGDAMFQGIKTLAAKVPYIVFTDADYTYPAQYIPQMVEILETNPHVGMVIGNRFKGQYNLSKTITNPFYVGNKLLAFAQLVMNGVNLGDPLSGLRVVRTQALDGWKPKSKGFDVEAEMNTIIERRGYGIMEVPIDYRDRMGEKKLKLRHGLGIMKRILSESFFFEV
ncbi:MAG: glycosyltransferase family 2 protein [Nitrososphaerota archaeon]|uniref:glycosyltransferase family 2 protein n=1 Tax=Candidatus Bathycorpusculum sp. TaxID=2994959 RepID=UPI002824D6FD|nr:glycosyltransferase family 2 protein [Candidatus Termitimicrobium sp.]MCL2431317.1 glycosyltransferase family 2 protein [Candidatus Termitimicrobium sp.]MDR0493816.1 glycosyltransferase family 2 protein [Nitrososphaerota archaeon]